MQAAYHSNRGTTRGVINVLSSVKLELTEWRVQAGSAACCEAKWQCIEKARMNDYAPFSCGSSRLTMTIAFLVVWKIEICTLFPHLPKGQFYNNDILTLL